MKSLFAIFAWIVIILALLIFGYVGTSPDLGIRLLLIDQPAQPSPTIVSLASGLRFRPYSPEVGDRIISLGPSTQTDERLARIRTFHDFTKVLGRLRRDVPAGGKIPAGSDPYELADSIPPFVEIEGKGWWARERWVEVELLKGDDQTLQRTWLHVHSLPLAELLLSLVWFLLQLGISAIAAVAFWTRPHDRTARLFFVMCVVLIGAFVGGYHWWVIAGNPWLNVPFCICAVLVPPITCHFFLVFPRPKSFFNKFPKLTRGLIYGLPAAACGILVTMIVMLELEHFGKASDEDLLQSMLWLRTAIQTYLVVAAIYFVGVLGSLVHSLLTPLNATERGQVRWILIAAVLATLPVGYTLYLALFDRVAFAVGGGSIPMFMASLAFMAAYAIGIVRFRLMFSDQILNREVSYLGVSFGINGLYSAAIAVASLVSLYQNMQSSRQAFVVATMLMIAVVLLGWLRDWGQRLFDRRFFREKYQLDKALQQMNQAVEPGQLASRLLGTCREVLLIERAFIYTREGASGSFLLIGSEGSVEAPRVFELEQSIISSLVISPIIYRIHSPRIEPGDSIQLLLARLGCELVKAFESDGEIVGMLLIGDKRNGTPYSAEDLTFLTAMGQVASVVLNSYQSHQLASRLSEELRHKVERISEQQRQIAMLQAEIMGTTVQNKPSVEIPFRREMIRGSSPAIRAVLDTVRKVAISDSSVLLRGESGTGKELMAQAIHENSPRASGPLVRVHCASLSTGLLESELFGHVKGSFTGAHKDKLGRFEMAHGGSLFLDEIGDISLETQIKLLRVLQERVIEPVGGTTSIPIDVRLIAATHQPLERLISEGKFREDLYYRLNVISITLPPLREREDDIFELALYFLKTANQKSGKRITHFTESAIDALKSFHWPGNVRQLENVIERAVVLAEGEFLTAKDLPIEFQDGEFGTERTHRRNEAPKSVWNATPDTRNSRFFESARKQRSQAQDEKQLLIQALREAGGNKAEAARLLGMPRSTFLSKLKRFE